MRSSLLAASICLGATGGLYACNGQVAATNPADVDADVADNASAHDAAASDGGIASDNQDSAVTQQTDAGSLQDAGPPVEPYEGGFENDVLGSGCPGWTCSNCTTTVVAGIAHSGNNSCKVCFTGPSASNPKATVEMPANGMGGYTLVLYIATFDDGGITGNGAPGTAATEVTFRDSANNVTNGGPMAGNAPFFAGNWTAVPAQTVSSLDYPKAGTTSASAAVLVSPVVNGDCWYVDDVQLTKY